MNKPTDITTKKYKLFGLILAKSVQTTFKNVESKQKAFYTGHIKDVYLLGIKIKSIHVKKENI